MTKPKSSLRPTGAPGAKSLITALAVASTLAGWAQLTAQEAPVAVHNPTDTTAAAAPPAWLLEPVSIPALPTVAASAPSQPAIAPAPSALHLLPAPVTSTRSSR